MHTGRGFERLVSFSDAVVAIALTLLVLPLVEIPADDAGARSLRELLGDHSDELTSFLISFLVIWVLWVNHHALLQNFRGYDGVIVRLHLLWLFTIVVLPFLTQLVNSEDDLRGVVPLYVASLLMSSVSLVGMSWWGRRHQELLHAEEPEVGRWLAEPLSFATAVTLMIALVLSLVIPAVGTWPLLALLIDDKIAWVFSRARRRKASRSVEPTQQTGGH